LIRQEKFPNSNSAPPKPNPRKVFKDNGQPTFFGGQLSLNQY
jgi:hypothetical protein